MTTILNELRASGGRQVIVHTVELQCDAWQPVYLCNGFRDLALVLETGENVIARATGMDVSLPKKDATGAQTLRFALDNVLGEATRLVRTAVDDGQEVRLIYRSYVSDDLSAPADNPLHMVVKNFTARGPQVDITAGFFDLIDTQFPRDVYTSEFAPGLKYL